MTEAAGAVPQGEHPELAPSSCDFVLHTHPGLVRPLNEDAIGAAPSAGVYILADGLGGYNAGEIASTMAVSSLLDDLTRVYHHACRTKTLFDPARVLRETLIAMNNSIYRAALNSSAFEGMATTIVVAWLIGNTLWVAHAGDSRLYRYRKGQLEQLTRDHSFSQELLDAGMVTEEEARLLPAKNLVTRALGASSDIEPEVNVFDVHSEDLLLLCSDGLTEMVNHYEMEGLLAMHTDGLDHVAHHLIDMANEAGGRDNISVVLIRLGEVAAVNTDEALAQTNVNTASIEGLATSATQINIETLDTILPTDPVLLGASMSLQQWHDPDYSPDFHVQPVI